MGVSSKFKKNLTLEIQIFKFAIIPTNYFISNSSLNGYIVIVFR